MKLSYLLIFFSVVLSNANAQIISNFESFNLPLDTFLNGSDGRDGFREVGHFYPSKYDNGFWSGGWALSTKRDMSTKGFANLYSSITASGYHSNTYAIGQNGSRVMVAPFNKLNTIFITNTTYAYNSMLTGDDFAKKFGGETGGDPDFFLLSIYPYVNGSIDSTRSVEFYLADFRFEDSNLDYIVNTWEELDISHLGGGDIDSIEFVLSSSDIGQYGINTPLFFAIDDFMSEKVSKTSESVIDIEISISPNPTSDYIIIRNITDSKMHEMKWELLSLGGERLLFGNMSDDAMLIRIEEFPPASYVFKMRNSQMVRSYIIIKE